MTLAGGSVGALRLVVPVSGLSHRRVYRGRYPTEEGLLPHGDPTRD